MHAYNCRADCGYMRQSKHDQDWQQLLTGALDLNDSLYNVIRCFRIRLEQDII